MIDHETCRKMLSSLSEYVDGTLEEALCTEIERHMADCENCRIVVDTLKKTITLYRNSAGRGSVPENLRQRLYHRLDLDEFLDL